VLLDGETYEVPITATKDGSTYIWETKPMAFSFLVQKDSENLNRWLLGF
jgi:hypothetical protein